MYSIPIKFPYPLFKNDQILYNLPRIKHFKINSQNFDSYFNKELINLIMSLKLEISFVEIFYRSPGEQSGIHIDSDPGDLSKINWIFGGKNSMMRWYQPKSSTSGGKRITPIGTFYWHYDLNDVNLICQRSLESSHLVQVGIPHDIYNPEQERFCASMVYRYKSGQRLTMQQSIEIFKDYV